MRSKFAWLWCAVVVGCVSGPAGGPERRPRERTAPTDEHRAGTVGLDALPWDERTALERAIAESDPRHAPTRTNGAPQLVSGAVSASFGDAAELHVGEHTATLRAISLQRGDVRTELGAVTPTIAGAEVSAERAPGIVEWWRSLASGLEHGVTIEARPEGEGTLTLALEVTGLGVRSVSDDAVELTDAGAPVATYAHLVVTDARGARVPATMRATSGGIAIRVDDEDASYPLVIDPIVAALETTLLGTTSNEQLGSSVAMSADGSRVLLGAPTALGVAGSGSAQVFVRTGTTWTLEATLVASDGAAGDFLGRSVALSDDATVALLGVPRDDTTAGTDAGSARVFVRTGSSWTEEATLVAPDAAMNDGFGTAVALSGDGRRALVGVPNDDPSGGPGIGGTTAGSGRVFLRTGTTWAQEATLSVGPGSAIGGSVALDADGDTALVGAPYATTPAGGFAGTVFAFARTSSWVAAGTILAPMAEAGASDYFGMSVGLSDDGGRAIVGAPGDDTGTFGDSGSARVYSRSGSSWTLEANLAPSDPGTGDNFGASVALDASGSRALVGAPQDFTVPSMNRGSARLFRRSGLTWSYETIVAIAGVNADFGASVALSETGGRAIVGSGQDDAPSLGNCGSGRVYTFLATPGTVCAGDDACGSGHCVDGVCCDSACGDGADDCQACSVAAGGVTDGACGPLNAVTAARITCRAAVGACDVEETCSPSSTTCPGDALHPASTVCRRASLPCDVPDVCDGTSAACPADAVAAAGMSCRAAVGACDVDDVCDGTSPECADARLPNGTECRPSLGACDPFEACDGTSSACPANVLTPMGTVCGVGMGDCATPGVCDGANPLCPSTGVRPEGTFCRAAASACDVDDFCDGTSQVCAQAYAPATQPCGGAPSGVCDAQDHCTGTSGDCMPEFLADVECRGSTGACDLAESCTGDRPDCPSDGLAPASLVCRASVGACDPAESCDGVSTTCPVDQSTCGDGGGTGTGGTDGGVPTGDTGVDAGTPAPVAGCACTAGTRSVGAGLPLGLGLLLALLTRRRG